MAPPSGARDASVPVNRETENGTFHPKENQIGLIRGRGTSSWMLNKKKQRLSKDTHHSAPLDSNCSDGWGVSWGWGLVFKPSGISISPPKLLARHRLIFFIALAHLSLLSYSHDTPAFSPEGGVNGLL